MNDYDSIPQLRPVRARSDASSGNSAARNKKLSEYHEHADTRAKAYARAVESGQITMAQAMYALNAELAEAWPRYMRRNAG